MATYTLRTTQRIGDRLISHFIDGDVVRRYCQVQENILRDEDYEEIDPQIRRVITSNEEACKKDIHISRIETIITKWE